MVQAWACSADTPVRGITSNACTQRHEWPFVLALRPGVQVEQVEAVRPCQVGHGGEGPAGPVADLGEKRLQDEAAGIWAGSVRGGLQRAKQGLLDREGRRLQVAAATSLFQDSKSAVPWAVDGNAAMSIQPSAGPLSSTKARRARHPARAHSRRGELVHLFEDGGEVPTSG